MTYCITQQVVIQLFLQNYRVKFFQQYFKNTKLEEKLQSVASEFLYLLGINDEALKTEIIKEALKVEGQK